MVEVPIRPWGVQAFASASGTSSDDATVFVGLPPGRAYERPGDADRRLAHPPPAPDRAGPGPRRPARSRRNAARSTDLLAAPARHDRRPGLRPDRRDLGAGATSARSRTPEAPEAARLADRIQGLVAELVTTRTTTAAGRGSRPARRRKQPAKRPAGLGARGLRARRGQVGRAPARARGPRQGDQLPGGANSPGPATTTRPGPCSCTPWPRSARRPSSRPTA